MIGPFCFKPNDKILDKFQIRSSYFSNISYFQGYCFNTFSVSRGIILAFHLHSEGYGFENPGRTPPSTLTFFEIPPKWPQTVGSSRSWSHCVEEQVRALKPRLTEFWKWYHINSSYIRDAYWKSLVQTDHVHTVNWLFVLEENRSSDMKKPKWRIGSSSFKLLWWSKTIQQPRLITCTLATRGVWWNLWQE